MISQSQRNNLKKLFGFRHIAKIAEHLREQEVKNRYGEDYSTVYISEVFRGVKENPTVEAGIWQLADKKMQEVEKAEEQQKEIMERFEEFTSPDQDEESTLIK